MKYKKKGYLQEQADEAKDLVFNVRLPETFEAILEEHFVKHMDDYYHMEEKHQRFGDFTDGCKKEQFEHLTVLRDRIEMIRQIFIIAD